MHNYQNLEVWQLAKDFCIEVYQITDSFPKTEIYGLTNQIRRASISISSNIAEGSGRRGTKESLKFIGYA